eukprot:3933974-Rhodomonas_salina.1
MSVPDTKPREGAYRMRDTQAMSVLGVEEKVRRQTVDLAWTRFAFGHARGGSECPGAAKSADGACIRRSVSSLTLRAVCCSVVTADLCFRACLARSCPP